MHGQCHTQRYTSPWCCVWCWGPSSWLAWGIAGASAWIWCGARRPCVLDLVLKECVGDGQLVEWAQLEEALTIFVHLANTVVSEGGRPCVMVSAHSCIEVPKDVESFIAGHASASMIPVKGIIEAVPFVSRRGQGWSIGAYEWLVLCVFASTWSEATQNQLTVVRQTGAWNSSQQRQLHGCVPPRCPFPARKKCSHVHAENHPWAAWSLVGPPHQCWDSQAPCQSSQSCVDRSRSVNHCCILGTLSSCSSWQSRVEPSCWCSSCSCLVRWFYNQPVGFPKHAKPQAPNGANRLWRGGTKLSGAARIKMASSNHPVSGMHKFLPLSTVTPGAQHSSPNAPWAYYHRWTTTLRVVPPPRVMLEWPLQV